MKIAIIGIVGVPANYGGYETLVDNLIKYRIDPNLKYVIYYIFILLLVLIYNTVM